MTETGYFESGENKLFYVYDPAGLNARPDGVLFVHAADSNRLGPHRMFVEAARRFNKLGFPTFRFDLAGCGDSHGEQLDDIGQEIVDAQNALRYFQALAGLEGIIVFGISRGSLVAFNAMVREKLPIKGMILLSIQITSGKAALRSFSHYLKEYLFKLGDIQTVKRLLKGQINLSGIFQTLVLPFLKIKHGKGTPKTTGRPITAKGPVLFIFGENDPIIENAKRHYSGFCDRNSIAYECYIVEKANHSFFHYKWKEEILARSEKWLGELLRQQQEQEKF